MPNNKWWLVIGVEAYQGDVRPRVVMVTTRAKKAGNDMERDGMRVVAYGPFKNPDEGQDFYKETPEYTREKRHSGNMLGNPRKSGGMTLREAQAHAKRLGYTIKSKTSTGEFVVSKSGERESERSYFTDDLDDAYSTMLHMSGQEHARAFRPFRGDL